jgi:hypothetical protein
MAALLLVLPAPAIWVNGYHDILWVTCALLGWGYASRGQLTKALPWWIFASTGKVEALIVCVGLMIFYRVPKRWFLLALVPSIFWQLTAKILGFSSSRSLLWPPQSLFEALPILGEWTRDLFLFRTFYGVSSVALWLGVLGFWRSSRNARVFATGCLAVFVSQYLISSFQLDWNIRFSWARLICFPFLLLALDSVERRYQKDLVRSDLY